MNICSHLSELIAFQGEASSPQEPPPSLPLPLDPLQVRSKHSPRGLVQCATQEETAYLPR